MALHVVAALVLTAYCLISKKGLLPISKVLTAPESATAEVATTTPEPAQGLSSGHRVVPAWGLQVFFGILAAMRTKKFSGAL